ncbi:LPXTG cell wall anchor domain-containing protein [Agaribacter marinus]|uniref:FIVAR domain-containing protein n=1 Tax=Virgibacillus salarius TaxID=447199 RepID=A0A941DWJ0_9BACI|nr:LPXTG cell wall anchor domain-containing protein [Virgibacillus salarius]MBR7796647.1 FIVAR domain-containing protein [Virgibacillus salarius]NAZ09357.1 LPXTG cell wall anchor domain-containing protein [Agaribacter marinus]
MQSLFLTRNHKLSFTIFLLAIVLMITFLVNIIPNTVQAAEKNSCSQPISLINGSFEEPKTSGDAGRAYMYKPSSVPGWNTTDSAIEIWRPGNPSEYSNYYPAPDESRWAELNAYENGMLYQDVETTPGQTLYWSLDHRGRAGEDTMQVRIGPVTDNPYDTVVQEQITDGNDAWGTHTGIYIVPEGQTLTRFGFEAVTSAGNGLAMGNFIDNIFFGTLPCLNAELTVTPGGKIYDGDKVTYKGTITNGSEETATNARYEDSIPEGMEYVPGTIKVTFNGEERVINDEDGFVAGKIVVNLGEISHNDTITVQYTVKSPNNGKILEFPNTAQVLFDNSITSEVATVETNEVLNNLITKVFLRDMVDKSDTLIETDYSRDSWSNYQEALSDAEAILADSEVTQAEVDEALAILTAAQEELTVNKTVLQSKVNESDTLIETDYSRDSWSNYQEALSDAEAVLADSEVTQAEIDEALAILTAAQEELTVNKTALQSKVNELDTLIETDYSPGSWSDFEAALTEAQSVLENDTSTQAEVDAALATLNEAYEELVRKESDKSMSPDQLKKSDKLPQTSEKQSGFMIMIGLLMIGISIVCIFFRKKILIK